MTDPPSDSYSGYQPTGNITAITLMHESGTGGAPKYGCPGQLPVVGDISNPLLNNSIPRAANDTAQVGHYEMSLANGVTVELAATEHAGMLKYGFPSNGTANVVVDVSHILPSFRGTGWGQGYAGGSLSIFGDGHYEGRGTYNNGWNLAPNWNIYFCGKFDSKPTSSKIFVGNGTALSQYGNTTSATSSVRVGGVFSFNSKTTVTSRVGVSWISSAKACSFIDDEIADKSLDRLVSDAKSKWNAQVFDKVQTSETNASTLTHLYSSLYGMHLLPSNRTGENPGWTSSEPYYDDIFTYWDLFRCTTALVHVLQPTAWEEQMRSIIDIWRHDGYLPDARSSNFNGRTQGGSNADQILADAYVKGVRGAINWDDGYAAMVEDAEVPPPNNHDPISPDSGDAEGRGALPDWKQYHYITPRFYRAISRAVEYAVNDFGLYQVAKGLGKDDDASKYVTRSRYWRNHWNPNATSLGFSGFMVPRYADGSFNISQDPLSCGGCYWPDAYYEAKPWEYSINAHHDIKHLISLAGGPSTFGRRLDTLLNPNLSIFDVGNEPSFTNSYLYHFIGESWRSVNQSRYIANTHYNPGRAGIPGNSDAGAMQSWILWNMFGLYPMTGQTTFLVVSPWFESLDIDLGGGKTLSMRAPGVNSYTKFFVQSLKINGHAWTKNWVTYDDVFKNGATMEFEMGSEPKQWERQAELPPSPATEA